MLDKKQSKERKTFFKYDSNGQTQLSNWSYQNPFWYSDAIESSFNQTLTHVRISQEGYIFELKPLTINRTNSLIKIPIQRKAHSSSLLSSNSPPSIQVQERAFRKTAYKSTPCCAYHTNIDKYLWASIEEGTPGNSNCLAFNNVLEEFYPIKSQTKDPVHALSFNGF